MKEDEKEFLADIGQIFRGIREEAGLGQREAAALVGSAAARVSYLENGKADIKILTLEKWANAYGYEIQVDVVPMRTEEET